VLVFQVSLRDRDANDMVATYLPNRVSENDATRRPGCSTEIDEDDSVARPATPSTCPSNGTAQLAVVTRATPSNCSMGGGANSLSVGVPFPRPQAASTATRASASTAATEATAATESGDVTRIHDVKSQYMSAMSSAVRMLSRAQQILEAAMHPEVVAQPLGQICWTKMGAKEKHVLKLAAAEAVANDVLSEAPKISDTNMALEQAVCNVASSTNEQKLAVDIDLFEDIMAVHKHGDLQAEAVAEERIHNDIVQPQSLSRSLEEMQQQLDVLKCSFAKFEVDRAVCCMSKCQPAARPPNGTPRMPQLKNSWSSVVSAPKTAQPTDNFDANQFRTALIDGSDESVIQLLGGGADPNMSFSNIVVGVKEFEYTTPLAMAVLRCKSQIMRHLLLARASPDSKYAFRAGAEQRMWEGTAMHAACPSGNLKLIRLLVEQRANVHATGSNGANLFWQAAYFGQANIANYAIEQSVDIEQVARHPDSFELSHSPLHTAAVAGHSSVAAVLLSARANPNVDDGQNTSPLEDAVACSHADVVQLLIGSNADVYRQRVSMIHKLQSAGRSSINSVALFKPVNCLDEILKSRNKALIAAAAQGIGSSPEMLDRLDISDFISFLLSPGEAPFRMLEAVFQPYSIRFWIQSEKGRMQRRQLSVAHLDTFGGVNIVAGPHHNELQRAFEVRRTPEQQCGSAVWHRFLDRLNPAPRYKGRGHEFVPVKLFMCHLPYIHENLEVQIAIADCAERRIFTHWGCRALVSLRWEAEKLGARMRMAIAFVDIFSLFSLTFCNVHITENSDDQRGWWRVWVAAHTTACIVWGVGVFLHGLLIVGYISNGLIMRYLCGWRHWLEVLNLTLAGCTVFVASNSIEISTSGLFRLALGIVCLFKWMKFLDQLRLIKAIGLRVLPIKTAMRSVGPFSGVLLIYLLGATNLYFALAIDTQDYHFMRCLMKVYHLAVIGEFEISELSGASDLRFVAAADGSLQEAEADPAEYHWVMQWFTVVTSFVISVVLMNLFIAMLCHSYTLATQRVREDLLRDRAAAVLEQFAMREGVMTAFCPRRAKSIRRRRHSNMQQVYSVRSARRQPTPPEVLAEMNDAHVWVAIASSKVE